MHLDDIESQFYSDKEGGKALIGNYREFLLMLFHRTTEMYNGTAADAEKEGALKKILELINELYDGYISILPRPSEPVELTRFERVITRQITRLSSDGVSLKASISMSEKSGEEVSVDPLFEFKKYASEAGFEVPLDSETSGEKVNISISRIDANNTFRWSSLIHEVSHVIFPRLYDFQNKIGSDEFFKEFLKESLIDSSTVAKSMNVAPASAGNIKMWLTECWCDLMACILIGPSFYFSQYLVFINDKNAARVDQKHPPAFFRLALIKNIIHHRFHKNLAELLEPYFHECAELVEALHEPIRKEDRKDLNIILDYFIQFFRDYFVLSEDKCAVEIKDKPDFNKTLRSLVDKFFLIDSLVIENLRDRLNQGFPVPSIKIQTDNNSNRYEEIPTYVQEIFLANWLSRCKELRPGVLNLIENKEKRGKNDVYKEVLRTIRRHNDAVLKSIQVSEWFDMLFQTDERPNKITLFDTKSIDTSEWLRLITKESGDYFEWAVSNMAVLNDKQIKGLILSNELEIIPVMDLSKQVGTTSIDVRLGTCFQVFHPNRHGIVDYADNDKQNMANLSQKINVDIADGITITPGQFLLGHTMEYVKLPNYLCGSLEGRSSFARLGIEIHMTAGFIDPGFEGVITLEIYNAGPIAVKLYPGTRIGQLRFEPSIKSDKGYDVKNVKYKGAMEHGLSQQKVDPEMLRISEKREELRRLAAKENKN